VAGTQPSLVFLKGSLYGNDGCNAVTGTFSADGTPTVTVTGSTYKLCTDIAVSTQAQDFTAAVEGASRVMVQGDQLILLGRAGTPLLQATADPARLLAAEGATWRLDNKDGRWGPGKESPITVRIGADTLSGNSGCGNYTAGFTHAGDVWRVQEPDVVPVPCPSTAGHPAGVFLSLLAKVTQVQTADGHLRLITPDETLSFSLK
jgi:heat shock protein HslJ